MNPLYLLFAVLAVVAVIAIVAPEPSEARSYTGTWKDSDGLFVAEIKDDRIKINLSVEDTTGLYWQGTFKAKSDHILSIGDKKALKGAIFGSENLTKLFIYKHGHLRFNFTLNGSNKVVEMRRTV